MIYNEFGSLLRALNLIPVPRPRQPRRAPSNWAIPTKLTKLPKAKKNVVQLQSVLNPLHPILIYQNLCGNNANSGRIDINRIDLNLRHNIDIAYFITVYTQSAKRTRVQLKELQKVVVSSESGYTFNSYLLSRTIYLSEKYKKRSPHRRTNQNIYHI